MRCCLVLPSCLMVIVLCKFALQMIMCYILVTYRMRYKSRLLGQPMMKMVLTWLEMTPLERVAL